MASQPHAVTDRQCPGCKLFFSPSGLSKHLAQTRKPACIALRNGQSSNAPSSVSAAPPEPSSLSTPFDDVDMDAPPIGFEGDFFGEYAPTFFDEDPEPSGDEPPSSDDDDDDDDDGGLPEFDRWEPEPQPNPPVATANTAGHADPPQDPESESRGSSGVLQQSVRDAIEANTARKTFVVRFPSSQAGAALASPQSQTGVEANTTYHALLQPTSADNAYYPFANRLDWLVARWAKMRGPGSTAFSELLAIEEVCFSFDSSSPLSPAHFVHVSRGYYYR